MPRPKCVNACACVYTKTTARTWTRHGNGGHRHCEFRGELSGSKSEPLVSKRTNHADEPDTTAHACTRAYTTSAIFETFCLPGRLLVVDHTANCRVPDNRYPPYPQARLRILRVRAPLLFAPLLSSSPDGYRFVRFAASYSAIDPLCPIVDSTAVCATCATD